MPAGRRGAARDVTRLALEIPGRPDPLRWSSHHMHDAGVIDPTTRAAGAVRGRQPGGQLLIGQTGTAILYTRPHERMPAVPKAAVLMEAGRPYVFVQTAARRFARRYDRDRRARRRRGRRKSGVKPGDASSSAAPTKCSSRRRPRACRPKATCTELDGHDETTDSMVDRPSLDRHRAVGAAVRGRRSGPRATCRSTSSPI